MNHAARDRTGRGGNGRVSAIYFISLSSGSFWNVVLGLLQAVVWPVYFTYHVLELLGA